MSDNNKARRSQPSADAVTSTPPSTPGPAAVAAMRRYLAASLVELLDRGKGDARTAGEPAARRLGMTSHD
jgi:hypothetical protein